MTDATTNIPDPNAPKSGSMDAVAQSMIVTPEPEDKPRSKKEKRRAKRAEKREARQTEEVIPDENASETFDETQEVDGLLDRPQQDEDRDEDVLRDDEGRHEEEDRQEVEDAEETSFDEWADYDDPVREASSDDGTDEESDDDAGLPLEITDDMELTVKVDGEERKTTIAELKKRYAGEGAIEKRLQEATEIKKVVKVVSQQVIQNRDQLAQVLNAVGGLLFTPKSQPPDPALAQANPGAFLTQQTFHQEELAALNMQRNQLNAALQKADEAAKESLVQTRQSEAVKLREALPVLDHTVRGPKVQKAIVDAAKSYGFTDEDISEASDHRLFVMAADAMRYRKLVAGSKAKPKTTRARTIRPTGSSNKPKRSATIKRQNAAMSKARASGKTDDVAATMIVKKSRERR